MTLRSLAHAAISDADARLVLEDALEELSPLQRWAVAIGIAGLAWAVEESQGKVQWDRYGPYWSRARCAFRPRQLSASASFDTLFVPTPDECRALGLLALLSMACDWEWPMVTRLRILAARESDDEIERFLTSEIESMARRLEFGGLLLPDAWEVRRRRP